MTTSTVSTSNLTMGPGSYFDAPFGTAEPATPATDPGTGWNDVGGTMGGITLSVAEEFTEIMVDQIIETPERRRTKREYTVATQLAETTLDNLAISMNEEKPLAATAGVQTFEPSAGDIAAFNPAYRACLFDGPGPGGLNRRVIVRKTLSTEGTSLVYQKDGQNVYAVTRTSHYVSKTIKSLSIKQVTSA